MTDTTTAPETDGVFEQIGEAIDRVGVPLAPMVASFGWVGTLAGSALYGAGGLAGLAIAGLGAACAAAAAGKRYRRQGSGARRAAAGRARGASALGSTGATGGRRRGLLGGSSGGGRSGGSPAGGGKRAGLGLTSGGGSRRSGSGSSGGGLGRLGLGRRAGGSGAGSAGGAGGGRTSSGGRAGRLRGILGRSGRGTPGGGTSTGGGAHRRGASWGRGPKAPTRGATPKSTSLGARMLRRFGPKKPRAGRRFGPGTAPARPGGSAAAATDQLRKRQQTPRGRVAPTVADPAKATTPAAKHLPAVTPASRTATAPPGARPTSSTGGTTMGKLRLVELANEMAASVGAISIEKGELYAFLQELELALPAFNEAIAKTYGNLSNKMNDQMPLNPAIGTFVSTLGVAQNHIGQASAEFPRLMRVLHKAEIDRYENPRTNEAAWNVQ